MISYRDAATAVKGGKSYVNPPQTKKRVRNFRGAVATRGVDRNCEKNEWVNRERREEKKGKGSWALPWIFLEAL